MLILRKSRDRGYADHGWLQSFHSFSFADYRDPAHMGFGNLRVINDDTVASGAGFSSHGHRDMEIVTYVLSGELAHQDNLGNAAVIRPGDVQRMSAGRGVEHSESNPSKTIRTHFLQIWLLPTTHGIEPGYEQTHFSAAEKQGRLRPIASADGRAGSVTLHADATVYAGLFDAGEAAEMALDSSRKTYVHLISGALEVNGRALIDGDAAMLSDEKHLTLRGGIGAEVLVFDLSA